MDPSRLFVLWQGGLMAWIYITEYPWSPHIILYDALSIILDVKLSIFSFDILLEDAPISSFDTLLEDAPSMNVLLHLSFMLLTCLSSKLGMREAISNLEWFMEDFWFLNRSWLSFVESPSDIILLTSNLYGPALVPSSLPWHRHNFGQVRIYGFMWRARITNGFMDPASQMEAR